LANQNLCTMNMMQLCTQTSVFNSINSQCLISCNCMYVIFKKITNFWHRFFSRWKITSKLATLTMKNLSFWGQCFINLLLPQFCLALQHNLQKKAKKKKKRNVKKRENWRVAAANLMGAVFKKLRFLILNFILPKSDVSYGICLIRKIQIGKSEFILDSCYQLFRCTNLKL